MRTGFRSRLTLGLLALVAATVTVIGIGAYVFVDARLSESLLADTARQVQFAVSVLVPGRLPPGADRSAFELSGLPSAFRIRGDADAIVDFGDGDPYVTRGSLLGFLSVIPDPVRDAVAAGRVGYAWLDQPDGRWLVVGGQAGGGPAVYLVADRAHIDRTLGQLRVGLIGAGVAALLLAVMAARLAARQILRPVRSASAAAARIAAGDLATRVVVHGTDEFAGWAKEFNRMAASLERSVSDLTAAQQQNRRFVSDVSHELRTPLAALVAEASMIEGGLQDLRPDARRAAELLVADVSRLRVLVEDLMELSRFDADAEQVHHEPVDIGRILGASIASRLPEATLDVPTEPIVVETDIRRLDRIIGNLLDNARTHAGGQSVGVSLRSGGGWVRVEIADRGPGVSEADLPHLFDRFFKADPSRGHGAASGSGLGLAIAAEHAELLGGSIGAESREGGGLIVRLALPVPELLPRGKSDDTDVPQASDMLEPTQRKIR
ncbi:MAG: HAMP domain-containing sensor histidine kinase [Chloroflexota bacterium]